MKRVDGKVALITGAARGQGRAHAVRLAEEGASIVAVDLVQQIASVPYDMASSDDLAETVALVERAGQKCLARVGDVRDSAALDAAVADAVAEMGGIDIVIANAGICSYGKAWELGDQQWQDMLDVNLTGVWRTVKAAIPSMIDAGRGGSIVITSSTAGLTAYENLAHYVSAKHGLVGLMKSLANELGRHRIRVNSIHPSSVDTEMLINDGVYKLFRPDLESPTYEDADEVFRGMHILPVALLDPEDISNAVLWLVSEEARYVTGVALPLDAGLLAK